MLSLNAGYELDGEGIDPRSEPVKVFPASGAGLTLKSISKDELGNIIFKDMDPGEVPEIDEKMATISVVDTVKDLDYLKADIVKYSGVNKTFALEAEKLIPGFINKDLPLTYFTDFHSKTNYKITLEAIDEQKETILQRIWKMISEFVKKTVEWVSHVAEKLFSNGEKADQAVAFYEKMAAMAVKLDQAQSGFEDPKSLVEKVSRLIEDKRSDAFKIYTESLKQKLEGGAVRVKSIYTAIAHNNTAYAVVVQNTVVKSILEMGESCNEIIGGFSNIDQRMLEDLLKVNSDADLTKRSADAAIKKVLSVAGKYGLTSFHSHSRQVEFSLQQRSAEFRPKNMPLSKILAIFNDTFKNHDMKRVGESLKKSEETLKGLQRTMYEFTTKPGWSSKEHRTANLTFINEVFRTIHLELRGIMVLLKFSTELYASWMWMGQTLDDVVSDFQKRVTSQSSGLDEKSKKLIFEYFNIEEKAA